MSTPEHDDLVRRSFERQVGLFTKADSPFAVRSPDELAWLGPLHPEMIVLDVACGAAQLDEEVAGSVRQVVGIDLTDALLAIGAARLREHGVGNVLLQTANAHTLPFVDASFDLVCCRASLHHLGGPAAAVTEMVRVCRSGGRVALSDLVAPSTEVRDEFDRVHQLIDPSHRRAFVAAELPQLFPVDQVALTPVSAAGRRLPLDIAMTEQSDRDAVVATLRAELAGGGPTGFEPAEVDGAGSFTVSFPACTLSGERR